MTNDFKVFTVSGTCEWAHVHNPNQFDNYSVDLTLDDPEAFEADIIKAHKVGQAFKDGKFQFRKKSMNREGKILKAPTVVDASLNAIPPSVLIGNGSKINVNFTLNTYKLPTGKSGVNVMLLGIQVLDLVEYKQESGFKKVKGFVIPDDVAADSDDEVQLRIDNGVIN